MIRAPEETVRHVPELPELRREWMSLHRKHLRKLRAMARGDRMAACDACDLADQKYMLWMRDVRIRIAWMVDDVIDRSEELVH